MWDSQLWFQVNRQRIIMMALLRVFRASLLLYSCSASFPLSQQALVKIPQAVRRAPNKYWAFVQNTSNRWSPSRFKLLVIIKIFFELRDVWPPSVAITASKMAGIWGDKLIDSQACDFGAKC
ncbi:hypothetical protein B0H14DRAFT_3132876 [Mycena olivaceomarginata]|nr:hypothetical protein B0H14DRAFT_3132876 [Mycena olivaceomarginata]